MLFILKKGVDPSTLIEKIKTGSASYRYIDLDGRGIVVAWPDKLVESIDDETVELKVKVSTPYQLASKVWRDKTIVNIGDVEVGDRRVVVAAGPCSIEDENTFMEIANAVKRIGGSMLRGGVFKPRTSPYTFQGLGVEGLKILKKVRDATGLPIVTEVLDTRDVPLVMPYADMLQIGARNAQNFALLREVGRTRKPVLLKRGMWMTIEEWLLSAEYILLEGNFSVVLCERGIRTFEKGTRFTMDIGGMVYTRTQTHLPIAADPSHPAGRRDLVEPLALAAVAAGVDMLLIEVHVRPEKALSDSEQQLSIEGFERLMKKLKLVAEAIGREL
ncbi:MAG: 3-deoxy-7-phosphoheptulonate synthase [Desulfurococcaceae archaeon]|nr:3-deoxy-7-phosphoheptulonate synthase [Desulfurococcaceae archaeon]